MVLNIREYRQRVLNLLGLHEASAELATRIDRLFNNGRSVHWAVDDLREYLALGKPADEVKP